LIPRAAAPRLVRFNVKMNICLIACRSELDQANPVGDIYCW
jgi:hypothetical protein